MTQGALRGGETGAQQCKCIKSPVGKAKWSFTAYTNQHPAADFHLVRAEGLLLQPVRDEGCCTAPPVYHYGNESSYVTLGRVFLSLLQRGSRCRQQTNFSPLSPCQTRSSCPRPLLNKSKPPSVCDVLRSVLITVTDSASAAMKVKHLCLLTR